MGEKEEGKKDNRQKKQKQKLMCNTHKHKQATRENLQGRAAEEWTGRNRGGLHQGVRAAGTKERTNQAMKK